MRPTHRIILNTAVTYGHSLLGLVLGLFSARWVLHALGEIDFGLFGVVGSIILLVTFLNGGLSVGVGRFFAYSIGRGETLPEEEAADDLSRWFNTAFFIHLILPIILIPIGWPIGEYAIHHWLTIPPERIEACIWVYRISLVGAFMSVFSVPFTTMYIARQQMVELAIFGSIRSISNFACAWFLLSVQSDGLIFYALYMMAINVGVTIVQIMRAICKFPACRPRVSCMYNPDYLKELFGFVGWKMFGMSCVSLRAQGTPVMTNLFFGPLVNAAYSVAFQLSVQANTLSAAMTKAFQPALVSAEGKGNRSEMLAMALQASKFGTLLVLFFVVPLILEMETVMHLWLQTPPKYSGDLCRWMLAVLVVDKLTSGQMLAVNARGRIAVYEIVQGTAIFLSLPLIWLFYDLGFGPASIGGAVFISTVIYCTGRVLFCKILLKLPIGEWILKVVVPVSALLVGSFVSGWGVMQSIDAGLIRLCLTTAVTVVCTAGIGWFWLLNSMERVYIRGLFKGAMRRLRSLF